MPKVRKSGSRNRRLSRGVNAFSRAQMAKKTGKWRFTGSGAAKAPKAAPAETKESKYYPADDVPYPLTRRFTPRAAKLRATLTPGTVCILLSGRHRGKRVVFLNQLPSGLLLVTGPYKVNGVPLRRVNQRYVIATSTKVDVSGVAVPDTVNDDFFKRPASAKKDATTEAEFFSTEAAPAEISEDRKNVQKAVDTAILKGLDATLKKYLGAKFSLTSGQAPHAMKF